MARDPLESMALAGAGGMATRRADLGDEERRRTELAQPGTGTALATMGTGPRGLTPWPGTHWIGK